MENAWPRFILRRRDTCPSSDLVGLYHIRSVSIISSFLPPIPHGIQWQLWFHVHGSAITLSLSVSSSLMSLSGRPIMIKDEDFETPQLDVDPVSFPPVFLPANNYFTVVEQTDDAEPWQPRGSLPYGTVPGRIMSTFVETSKLG